MKIQAGLLSLLAITAFAQSTTSYPGSCIGRCGLRGTEQGVNTGNAGPVPGVPPPFGPYPGAGGAYPGYGYPGYGYPGYGPVPIYGRQYYPAYGYGGYGYGGYGYGGYGYGGYGYGGYGYGGYGYGGYGYGGYGYGGYGYGGYYGGYGAGYPAPGYRPPPVQSCSCDQGCFSRGTCCEDVNGRGGVTTECQLASRYPTASPTTAPPTTAPPTTAPPTTAPPTTAPPTTAPPTTAPPTTAPPTTAPPTTAPPTTAPPTTAPPTTAPPTTAPPTTAPPTSPPTLAPPTTPPPTAATTSPTRRPTNVGDTFNPTRAPTSTPTTSPTNPPTSAPTDTVKIGTGATTIPDSTDTCTRAPTCPQATVPVSTPPAGTCVFWDPVVGAFDSAIKATSCNANTVLGRITLGWEKNLGPITILAMANAVNKLNDDFADATNKQAIANAYNAAVYPGAGRRLLQAITDPSAISTVVSYRQVTPAPTASPTTLPTPPTATPTLAPPTITDITFRPAVGLGQGQTFDIVVTFDRAVTVSDESTAVYPTMAFSYTTTSSTTTSNTATFSPSCTFNDFNNGKVCFSHTTATTLSSAVNVYVVDGSLSLPANAYISYNNAGARGADATLTYIATTVSPKYNVNNKYVLVQAAKVESFAMTRPTVGSTKFQVNVTYDAEVFVSTQSTFPTITTEIKAPDGTAVSAATYASSNSADVYYVSQTVTGGKSTLVFERDLIESSTFGGAWIEGMTFNVLGTGTGTGAAGRDIMGAIKTQTPTYVAGTTPYIQNANAQGVGTSSGLPVNLGLTTSTGAITVSGLGINTGITVYKSGTTQTTAIQGDVVRVTLSYDQTVTVTGSPKITLYAYTNANGVASAVANTAFDLLAVYVSSNGNSLYFDATTLVSAAVGTTDSTKPSTSLRYVLNNAVNDVMTILNSGSTPSTVGTIVEPNSGETVYHFHEYQMSTIKKTSAAGNSIYFTVGLAIQRVQWSGTSGQNAKFTVTYGGNVQVTNAAFLTYAEQLKGSTTTNLNKQAFLVAAVAGAQTVEFVSQSATGAIDATSLTPTTYVFGDKVWVPFSNYGTNGVTLGGGAIYKDASEVTIAVDAVMNEADLSGLGGSSTAPYTFPTASAATLAKYTSSTFTKEAATNGNANAMDIKVVVTMAQASATNPADLANVKLQLKAINGASTSVTALDLLIDTPVSGGGNTIFTWTKTNTAYTATYGYSLYFEGVESTNDGARVQQTANAVQFTVSNVEIFGAIPGQKLPTTGASGLKSNPLLIALNIKEWYIGTGGTNIAQVKVEWYGAVSVVSGSTIEVKSKTAAFGGANCNDATSTIQATLVTTTSAAIQDFNTAAGTAGHVIALEDATGVAITNTGATNPVTDPTYALNYPVKTLVTANVKAATAGKCSNANAGGAYVLA